MDTEPLDTQPPRVAHPVMYHQWNWITFLHWRYPPQVVQSFLPAGLTIDTYDGAAWIGLTPFLMAGVRPPGVPALPWLSRFGEVNVRTYVRDTGGRRGIWFFSLDAARLPAVLAARAAYRLPYFWSDVTVRVAGDHIGYHCRRHAQHVRCDAQVRLGAPLAQSETGRDELAEFLTARYRLFTVVAGRLAAAEAEHRPWPLHHARVLSLDQDLLAGAGLPAPAGDPLAHASPGVPVRIGMWHWCGPVKIRSVRKNQDHYPERGRASPDPALLLPSEGKAMAQMPTVRTLDELTDLARAHPGMYVRWSRGPAADARGKSSDDLTGEPLPGLSANPLAVEPWWGDRPLRLWIARRLFDYSHLKHVKGPGVRPWLLDGRELARGPDNEPLIRCDRPLAWVDDRVISEAVRTVDEQNACWGPLRRPATG